MAHKLCPKCDTLKDLEDFHKCRARSDGRTAWCKSCGTAYNRAQRDKDPQAYAEYQRWYFLERKYGITREGYEALYAAQEGKCAICKISGEDAKRPGKPRLPGKGSGLCVDHDHVTGKIRGLLCNRCNLAVGFFDKNPDLFDLAIEYLRCSFEG